VLRDIAQVRGGVELVVADLRRVLGPTWSCEVSDDWVLTVSDGVRAEPSMLDREVEDEAWYVDSAWTPEQQQAALAVEATEAVASEVLEVLRVLGTSRLTCLEHGADLGACESVWYCERLQGHDVAFVGCLGTDQPFAGAVGGESE
jgi:hypothetical protein